ncbi:hypothetical protein [Azospirillum cavernae]|nr:hypothetical protein [Azospirillum cavernae]
MLDAPLAAPGAPSASPIGQEAAAAPRNTGSARLILRSDHDPR